MFCDVDEKKLAKGFYTFEDACVSNFLPFLFVCHI